MISKNDLKRAAVDRLADATVLTINGRYDGAIYLCGYAIELALKARICTTLKWAGFPETRGEFENYQSFKIHKLDVLLHMSGVEDKVKTSYPSEWAVVAKWSPEMRYRPPGTATANDINDMLGSVKKLLKVIR
jgi:hypothetical protein